MPAPKFNFIPERQLKEPTVGDGNWKITILASKATPVIYFSSEMVKILELDGKYFRFFADRENKAIGWEILQGNIDGGIEELADARQGKANVQTGALTFGLGKMFKAMGYEIKKSLKGLPVHVHSNILTKKDINYVTLPDIEKPYVPSPYQAETADSIKTQEGS